MTWTAHTDVTDAWIGEGAPTDVSKLTTWIAKAEREIRRQVPDIVARIDAEENATPPSDELLETAKDVTVAMVTRVFRNPEGIRQRNTTTGPFTESATYGGEVPGGLAITDDELSKLRGIRDGGAFSISLIPSSSPFYEAP